MEKQDGEKISRRFKDVGEAEGKVVVLNGKLQVR